MLNTNLKEGDTILFICRKYPQPVSKQGKISKILDYGKKYGLRINVYDGEHINHIDEKDVVRVIGDKTNGDD